jgi:hypothetical protein
MKFKQLKSVFVIFSLVVVALAGSIGSMGSSLNSENSASVVGNEFFRVKVKSQSVGISSFNDFSISSTYGSNETGVFVVTNETEDEYGPSIVTYLDRVLVAYEYEDENGTHVALRSSKDHGQTWPGFCDIGFEINRTLKENLSGINLFSPTFTVNPQDSDGYGTIISSKNDSAILYDLEFTNIGDLDAFSISGVDWSDLSEPYDEYKFWGFKDATIVYYKTSTRTQFIATVIGSTDFEEDGEGPCTDCPMFFYRDAFDEDDYWISWDPSFENCRNISAVMDYDTNIIYGVCEIQNGSNKDLLFFNDDPTKWDESSYLKNKTISSSENLMHPNIFLKEDNIYITAETDTQGLILYYSSNDGKNWTVYNITSPDLNAGSPVLYANESHLACFFVESGNLSMKTTIDNGKNWADPIQINDYNGTVDSAYRNFDVGNMNKIIWTDTREGNKDLYYLLNYIPKVDLAVTNFTIVKDDFFPTFNWISIEVQNIGDAPSSSIQVNITYTCEGENAIATEYPGYIQSIGPYETVIVKRPLFRFKSPEFFQSLIAFAGLRNITVYLDPGTVTDDDNPTNNIYPEKPVSYSEIFPKLGPFEEFFKKLKFLV